MTTALGAFVAERRKAKKMTQSSLARLLGVSPQSVQQLETGHTTAPRFLVQLAEALGEEPGYLVHLQGQPDEAAEEVIARAREVEMDAEYERVLPEAMAVVQGALGKRIPVYASAQAGPGGMSVQSTPIDWVDRPGPMATVRDAFAVYVVNDCMEPRYHQGDLLLINPHKPVRPGQDALVVTLREDDGDFQAMVKIFKGRSGEQYTLAQLNPAKEITVPSRSVANLYLVAGCYFDA
jgi:phage repressor protein C with HTH and peptisase S24 domain